MTELPQTSEPPRRISKLWVPIVVLAGIILGIASSFLSPATEETVFTNFGGFFFKWEPDPVLRFHVALTTLQIVLLFALLAVYLKVYLDTRARFSLGIIVVLWALMVQAVLNYPLLEGMVGPVPVGPGPFLPFADIFMIIAYTVFLYLSLE